MCISGLVVTTRVHLLLLNQVNKCILDIPKAHNVPFINNDNISKSDMYKDGLYLLHSSKPLLSNNFIENINVLKVQTHHPHVSIHIPPV